MIIDNTLSVELSKQQLNELMEYFNINDAAKIPNQTYATSDEDGLSQYAGEEHLPAKDTFYVTPDKETPQDDSEPTSEESNAVEDSELEEEMED